MSALDIRHHRGGRGRPSRMQCAWERLHTLAAPLRCSSELALVAFVVVMFIAHYLR